MIILIDNGHGIGTKGKQSPDGRLREWAWTRAVAQMLQNALAERGVTACRVVTEIEDIPLSERVRRVNAVCREQGANNCLLVSIHVNAAGNGDRWHDAHGWTAWVSETNASDRSKRLASALDAEAIRLGLKGNRSPQPWWPGNLAIVRDTACAAVLTENMFMDNRDDVEFLLSDEGKHRIVDLHVNGIINFLKS